MDATRLLTKTEFIRGLDCNRRAWLDRNRPDLKAPLSLATRERIEVGKRLGDLARERYSGGVFATRPGADAESAIASTNALIEAGADCLFEATFISGGRLARLDILSKQRGTGWTVDEVKSSSIKEPSKIDEEKVFDLAFQVHTAKQAGLEIEQARLVLVDTSFVWDGLCYSSDTLLGTVNLTELCNEKADDIEARCSALADALSQDTEPVVEKNTHCKTCDYFAHCHESSPKHDLIFLPRISPKAVNDLRAKGYTSIDQIPDAEKLTDARRRMRDVIVAGQPYIAEGLRPALDAIPFPAVFIDYESSNPAFPMYPGTRPYQQVCFQWSAHLLDSPKSALKHFEYLASSLEDPRAEFCRSLWELVKDCAAIVHYTGYEITQLRAIATDGVPLASELLELILARSVDLEKIVSEHVYFEAFKGKTSIKVVLPALVPAMSYKDLLIADGTAAATGFRRMLDPNTSKDEAASLRSALLAYCCQDTLAMVEIYRALRELAF
jgi:predicted RecB family nuclease